MWEMIERMASDRLWIYTALAGSLFLPFFVFVPRHKNGNMGSKEI